MEIIPTGADRRVKNVWLHHDHLNTDSEISSSDSVPWASCFLKGSQSLSVVRRSRKLRTLHRTKPRPASALLLLLCSRRYRRRRILNFDHLECPKELGQIDYVVCG